MPSYETVFAIPSIISEEEKNKSIESVEKLISESSGQVISSDDMGERKLAYSVKGNERAYYHVIKFDMPSSEVNKLKGHYRLEENFIRDIVVKEEG